MRGSIEPGTNFRVNFYNLKNHFVLRLFGSKDKLSLRHALCFG